VGNNTRKAEAKILNKTDEMRVITQVITESPLNMSGLPKRKVEKDVYRETFSLWEFIWIFYNKNKGR